MSLDIEALKAKNSQELPKLDEPYQLKVLAIPERQWTAFTALLHKNLPMLPTALELLNQTASEHNLNEKTRRLHDQLTELSLQAGKHHDICSKNLNALEISLAKQITQLRRAIKIWLLTGFLSLVIFLGLLVILAR